MLIVMSKICNWKSMFWHTKHSMELGHYQILQKKKLETNHIVLNAYFQSRRKKTIWQQTFCQGNKYATNINLCKICILFIKYSMFKIQQWSITGICK